MNQRYQVLAVIAVTIVALSGCAERSSVSVVESRPDSVSSTSASEPAQKEAAEQIIAGDETEKGQSYIDQLVQDTIAELIEPGMSDYEKVKAAFDYMIEANTLLEPIGLELWRVRGNDTEPPSYVENRSLSILLFHVGKCEDYAAALTLLLQGMGLEAQYVPGLTYSTQGELVDHAWTVVLIDGVWYHLDCQLEQNISRHGTVRYKYFLRSDATMSGSHRWGENLIHSGLLRADQNEEIAQKYTPPACPQDYQTPEKHDFTVPAPPDTTAIQAEVDAEIRAYENTYGLLEPLELNIIPPVFALEGFGPQD